MSLDIGREHHWEGLIPSPDRYHGFLYLITDTHTNKKYVGKKAYTSTRRVKVPGRKNRKVVKSSNKWEFYTGSSGRLNELLKEKKEEGTYGTLTFTILGQYEAKGDLYYAEIKEQVSRGVLVAKLDNGEKEYFNGNINGIKFIPPCKDSEVLDV